jgi:hypothetical protein
MFDIIETQGCDFCRNGPLIKREQRITFHQRTDKGHVYCRALVPIEVCEHCGAKSWDEAADAIIEEAIRHQYEKLA